MEIIEFNISEYLKLSDYLRVQVLFRILRKYSLSRTCIDDIIKQIDNITSQLKVYISYSGRDKYLYDKIKLALLEKDFLVLDNESMSGDIVLSIKNQIDQTVRNGFVLLLVTKNSIKSEWIKREIEYAKISGGKIIPIYVGDATLDKALSFHLGEVQGVHLDEIPSQEQIKKIILEIQHHINYYNSDFSIFPSTILVATASGFPSLIA